MTAPSLISIVTPVKNGEAYLQRALDSVAAQSWRYEHIVVDGMSTDGTQEILDRNRSRIAKVIRAADESATEALNRGVLESTGDVICLLMADDWLPNNALAAIGDGFAKNASAEILAGSVRVIDETESPTLPERTLLMTGPALDIERFLGTPYAAAFSFRRSLWTQLGGFRPIYRYGADRDFLMRCLLSHVPAAFIDETTYAYSINESSDTLVDNPSVVEAFLGDHLIMAHDWLSGEQLSATERTQIEQWRRIQANELFGRRVRRGKLAFAVTSIVNQMRADPAQFPSIVAWCNQRIIEKVKRTAS